VSVYRADEVAACCVRAGLAVDHNGVLYIADGITLRTVDQRGRIATVFGSQPSTTSWRPLLCYHTAPVPASQVRFCCLPACPDSRMFFAGGSEVSAYSLDGTEATEF